MTDEEKNLIFNLKMYYQKHSSGQVLRLSMAKFWLPQQNYKDKKGSKLFSVLGASENPSRECFSDYSDSIAKEFKYCNLLCVKIPNA